MAFNRPNKEEGRAHTSTTVKMWQFIHSEMRYIQNTWKASMAMQSSRWFPLTCWIRSDVPGEFPALNFSVSSWTKITQRKRLNVSHHTDEVVHQKAQKTTGVATGVYWKLCFGSVFLSIMPIHEKTRRARLHQTFELVWSGRGTKATCRAMKKG